MELTLATYKPFDGIRQLNVDIVRIWRRPSFSCLETAKKVVQVACYLILSLGVFILEAILALPILAVQRCSRREEEPQPAPQPQPQPQPREEAPEMEEPEPQRLMARAQERRRERVRPPIQPQPAPIVEEELPADPGALPLNPEESARVFGNPYMVRFPREAKFYTDALEKGFEEIPEDKKEVYRQLIANPRGPAGEIEPIQWSAACAIAHYIIYKWHVGTFDNHDCPHFLLPYLDNDAPGTKSLRQMSWSFRGLNPLNGPRTRVQYDDQAAVLIKLRNPLRPLILSPAARKIVRDANNLARIVARDAHFSQDIYG